MDDERLDFLSSKALTGEIGRTEKKELKKLLKASSEGMNRFKRDSKIWCQLAPRDLPVKPNVEREWQRLAASQKLPYNDWGWFSLRPGEWSRKQLNFARALAAAVAILILVLIRGQYGPDEAHQIIATGNNQTQRIELPDGSAVHMNYASSISFRSDFPDSLRQVRLAGEAFFRIVPSPRPFIVLTDNAIIRVLGTSFSVWARDQQTRVIVKEGRVRLQDLPGSYKASDLGAGTASMVDGGKGASLPDEVDADYLLSWLEGRLVFETAPLNRVVSELQMAYDVEIVLANPAMGMRTLTGEYHKDSFSTILKSLCLALNLNYHMEGEVYVLSSAE